MKVIPKIAVLLVTLILGGTTRMASAAYTTAGTALPAAGSALPAITQSTFTPGECYTSCVLTLPSHPVGGMSCVLANTSGFLAPTSISNTAGFSWSPWIGSVGIGEDTVWASCAPTLSTPSTDTVTVSFADTDYHNGILWADVSNVNGIDNSIANGQVTYGTPTLSFPVTGSNDMVIAIVFIVGGSQATSGPGFSLFPTLSDWGADTFVEYEVATGSPALVTASNTVSGYNITAVALKSSSPTAANVSISGTPVSVVPGATTGNTSTITVTPSGGFTGSVALTATITSSPTGGQNLPTLSFGSTSPVNITGFGSGTAILTITTTAATSSALTYPKRPGAPWFAGGSALACLLLIVIPARRRRGWAMLGMLALMVALSSSVLACGGSLAGGGGGGAGGTTAGTYTITVTGISGTLSQTGTVTLTVQ